MDTRVCVEGCGDYAAGNIAAALDAMDHLFSARIAPGDRVVIKPNWVAERHKRDPGVWVPVITHPALISGVIGKVVEHLKGRGQITVADSPQHDSSFPALAALMPLGEWEATCSRGGVGLEVLDLRDEAWTCRGEVILERKALSGDPAGSVLFRLPDEISEFSGHSPGSGGYYGAMYDKRETMACHSGGWHAYRVSRTVVDADVFINLPKLKAHRKSGMTCSLKNVIGIATLKNCLPHHTEGTPARGGDQFPDDALRHGLESCVGRGCNYLMTRHESLRALMVPAKRLWKRAVGTSAQVARGGSWHGNDTIWRTVLDLNKILLYGCSDGTLRPARPEQRKKYLSIVDAVVSGEGDGPLAPDPVPTGLILAGTNPIAVDALGARVMGFDYRKIPVLKRAFEIRQYPLAEFAHVEIVARSRSMPGLDGPVDGLAAESCFAFRPPFGWVGHVEAQARPAGEKTRVSRTPAAKGV